jgi:hypothetical protein
MDIIAARLIDIVAFYSFLPDYGMNFGSSSSVCGAGGIPPNALQPTEAYCANPAFWFPRSSP